MKKSDVRIFQAIGIFFLLAGILLLFSLIGANPNIPGLDYLILLSSLSSISGSILLLNIDHFLIDNSK